MKTFLLTTFLFTALPLVPYVWLTTMSAPAVSAPVQPQSVPAVKAAEPSDNKVKLFRTDVEAALYIVSKIYERSHYYEYGGVILKTPKGYAISLPNTQRHGTDVEFSEDPESFDYPIVASYHVHPCLENVYASVFSPTDLSGSRSNNHAGYVLDECTGALHYWAPGGRYMSSSEMLKLGILPSQIAEGLQVSAGTIVGVIDVDGVILN